MVPPALFGVSMEEALMMAEEDYAARVLGALLDQFTNLAEKAHVIHYPDMPTALWGWLDDLGIDPPNEARTAMQEVSAQNAKRPRQVFHPDGAAKKAAATAAQTEAVARYAMEPYLRLRAKGHPVV